MKFDDFKELGSEAAVKVRRVGEGRGGESEGNVRTEESRKV